ncbi:LysR family transcriptional regulator [Meridianimarinicoccus marinus]
MKAFVRTVELGSFTRVAEEAGMKVSTVSRHVSALEADLGAAMFNRTTRQIHLTEAGATFYEYASRLLTELEEARNATSMLNAEPRGLLRINIPTTFGRLHVMPHMKVFLAQNPEIRIDATLTDETVDIISTGTDVAVRIGVLADSSLLARKLAPLQHLLVASPDYLATKGEPTTPEELASHECLVLALQQGNSRFFWERMETPDTLSEITVNGILRANDAQVLQSAACDGLGIALLPSWLVSQDIHAGRLVRILTDFEWFIAPERERAISAVYPPKKVVPPKVRAFVQFLVHSFGAPPYWDRPDSTGN